MILFSFLEEESDEAIRAVPYYKENHIGLIELLLSEAYDAVHHKDKNTQTLLANNLFARLFNLGAMIPLSDNKGDAGIQKTFMFFEARSTTKVINFGVTYTLAMGMPPKMALRAVEMRNYRALLEDLYNVIQEQERQLGVAAQTLKSLTTKKKAKPITLEKAADQKKNLQIALKKMIRQFCDLFVESGILQTEAPDKYNKYLKQLNEDLIVGVSSHVVEYPETAQWSLDRVETPLDVFRELFVPFDLAGKTEETSDTYTEDGADTVSFEALPVAPGRFFQDMFQAVANNIVNYNRPFLDTSIPESSSQDEPLLYKVAGKENVELGSGQHDQLLLPLMNDLGQYIESPSNRPLPDTFVVDGFELKVENKCDTFKTFVDSLKLYPRQSSDIIKLLQYEQKGILDILDREAMRNLFLLGFWHLTDSSPYDNEINLIGKALNMRIHVFMRQKKGTYVEKTFGATKEAVESVALFRTKDNYYYGIIKNASLELVRASPSSVCIGKHLPRHQHNFYTAVLLSRGGGMSIQEKSLNDIGELVQDYRLLVYDKVIRYWLDRCIRGIKLLSDRLNIDVEKRGLRAWLGQFPPYAVMKNIPTYAPMPSTWVLPWLENEIEGMLPVSLENMEEALQGLLIDLQIRVQEQYGSLSVSSYNKSLDSVPTQLQKDTSLKEMLERVSRDFQCKIKIFLAKELRPEGKLWMNYDPYKVAEEKVKDSDVTAVDLSGPMLHLAVLYTGKPPKSLEEADISKTCRWAICRPQLRQNDDVSGQDDAGKVHILNKLLVLPEEKTFLFTANLSLWAFTVKGSLLQTCISQYYLDMLFNIHDTPDMNKMAALRKEAYDANGLAFIKPNVTGYSETLKTNMRYVYDLFFRLQMTPKFTAKALWTTNTGDGVTDVSPYGLMDLFVCRYQQSDMDVIAGSVLYIQRKSIRLSKMDASAYFLGTSDNTAVGVVEALERSISDGTDLEVIKVTVSIDIYQRRENHPLPYAPLK